MRRTMVNKLRRHFTFLRKTDPYYLIAVIFFFLYVWIVVSIGSVMEDQIVYEYKESLGQRPNNKIKEDDYENNHNNNNMNLTGKTHMDEILLTTVGLHYVENAYLNLNALFSQCDRVAHRNSGRREENNRLSPPTALDLLDLGLLTRQIKAKRVAPILRRYLSNTPSPPRRPRQLRSILSIAGALQRDSKLRKNLEKELHLIIDFPPKSVSSLDNGQALWERVWRGNESLEVLYDVGAKKLLVPHQTSSSSAAALVPMNGLKYSLIRNNKHRLLFSGLVAYEGESLSDDTASYRTHRQSQEARKKAREHNLYFLELLRNRAIHDKKNARLREEYHLAVSDFIIHTLVTVKEERKETKNATSRPAASSFYTFPQSILETISNLEDTEANWTRRSLRDRIHVVKLQDFCRWGYLMGSGLRFELFRGTKTTMSKEGDTPLKSEKEILKAAEAITATCYQLYRQSMGTEGYRDVFYFSPHLRIEFSASNAGDASPGSERREAQLRGILLQSFLELYAVTQDPMYASWTLHLNEASSSSTFRAAAPSAPSSSPSPNNNVKTSHCTSLVVEYRSIVEELRLTTAVFNLMRCNIYKRTLQTHPSCVLYSGLYYENYAEEDGGEEPYFGSGAFQHTEY